MMSHKLEIIMNTAIRMANDLRHEYLTLETVLMAMLNDEQVLAVLEECGAELEPLRQELDDFIRDQKNFSLLTEDQIEELSRKHFVDEELRQVAQDNGIKYQPEISLSLQRVLQRAAIHVQASGKQQIRGINILVAMFQESESFALYLLQKQGVGRFNVVQAIAHDLDRPVTGAHEDEEVLESDQIGAPGSPGKRKNTPLEEFSVNLNNLARENQLDPLIGREEEVRRVVQVLCRRRKNNPLLVGDAGVGKTAIAEGLAWSIENDKVPEVLKETTVYSLDMAALLAGAKFRGDFEQRFKGVLKELQKHKKEGKKSILFIDEIHTVMGAGATAGGSMDASNLLKPYLSSGQIKCLGSTTHEEYRKFIEKDSAFSRRFQKIDVDEPSKEDTYKILQGLRPRFEDHHGVNYPNSVLRSAIDLSVKHLSDRKLPDKAIDVIDEAGALIHLLPESKKRKKITLKDIEGVIAALAKIPQKSVSANEKDKLSNLREDLKRLIFGQDEAVDRVSDAILMARSGLGHEEKPLASFLFSGPTGVGKTELARQLSALMGVHFERFDMSEYMEKHSVAKLIGAPPGYVGHDRGGLLTDAIKKSPYCVLLLDEIEKAHSDVYNVLLQVMDHGTLTDAHGRNTDFRNVVLIMTTNAGAKDMEAGAIGLSSKSTGTTKRDQAIKNFFTPEFRNRLDGIIHFNKLGDDFIISIVDKFLYQLETKLAGKGVAIEVSDDAREWLADEGYDDKMGARPIERLINEKITKPLSQEILFGKLEKGGSVLVKLNKDREIDFEFSSKNS